MAESGAHLEVTWQFQPTDYFEQCATFALSSELSIEVSAGMAIGRFTGDDQDRHAVVASMRASFESLLRGVQLASARTFEVGTESVVQCGPNGSRGHVILCKAGTYQFTLSSVDISVTGPDGARIDTKRDRLERKRRLAGLAAKHAPSDPAVRRMLRSFDNAMRDPEDEFIHLYEIADAFEERFAGAQRDLFRQHKKSVESLGRLANGLPIKQGRHRGYKLDQELREATPEELAQGRACAVALIEGALHWLDQKVESAGPAT